MATPTELMTSVRQRYNAVGDAFFSDQEIFDLFWDASLILSLETNCLKGVDSSITTVDGTRSYSFPTQFYRIHRIEWNGIRLDPTDFMEDDFHTGNDPDTTATGEPRYYQIFDSTLYLRPVPNAAQTVKILGDKFPAEIVSGGTIEVPERYHNFLKDFALAGLYEKDGNERMAALHLRKWDTKVNLVKRTELKRYYTSDQYKVNKVQEQMPIHDVEHFK